MRVPHLSLDLSPRHQGRHRVYNDDIEGAGADECIRYLQGLFAVIRLGKVEVFEVNADSLGVGRVDGVLGVDEGGEAPCFLRLCDNVQGEGRLAAGLGTEDLDDAAPGEATHAEGDVEGQGAGRNGGDALALLVAHAHDRTLPELPLYLGDGGVYSLALIQCILQKANVSRLISIVLRPIVLECSKDLTSQNALNNFSARLGQNHRIWKQGEVGCVPMVGHASHDRRYLPSSRAQGSLRGSDRLVRRGIQDGG